MSLTWLRVFCSFPLFYDSAHHLTKTELIFGHKKYPFQGLRCGWRPRAVYAQGRSARLGGVRSVVGGGDEVPAGRNVELMSTTLGVHDLLGQVLPGQAGGDVEQVDVGPALGREGQGQGAHVGAAGRVRVVEAEAVPEVRHDGVVLAVDGDHTDEAVGPELEALGPAAVRGAVLDDRAGRVASVGVRRLGVGQGDVVGLDQGPEGSEGEQRSDAARQPHARETDEDVEAIRVEQGEQGAEADQADDDDHDLTSGGEVVVPAEQDEEGPQYPGAQREAEQTEAAGQTRTHGCSRLSI